MAESKGNRKFSRQYWQQIVMNWEKSDIKTQKEFCEKSGISTKSLSRWCIAFNSSKRPRQKSTGFTQVKVSAPKPSNTGVRIRLDDNAYIDVPVGFDESTLRRVLSILQ